VPTSWATSDNATALINPGGVKRDTAAANVYEGTSAISLTTKLVSLFGQSLNVPGLVSLGKLTVDIATQSFNISGLPYASRPDSVKFAYKYASGGGGVDTGGVVVTLTRRDGSGNRQVVANAFFAVTDAATYQTVTAKINYNTFFNPDTLLIQGLSSTSQNGIENSNMILDALAFVGLDTVFKVYTTPRNAPEICEGDAVDLSAEEIPGDTYLWHKDGSPLNSETNATLIATTAGQYYVQVTHNGQAYNSDVIPVTVLPLPNVTLALQDTACSNLSAVPLSGGNPSGGDYSGTGVTNNTFSPSAAGTGSATITYTYEDNSGCVNSATDDIFVKTCTGIEVFMADVTVNIYPNPASNYLVFEVNDKLLDGNIQIMDAAGKVVNTFNIKNKFSKFNIEQLPSGIYTTKITTAKGELAVSSTLSVIK
jgi:hypothetical protein